MNHYQVLGVAYDDPPEKIRARYRLLALSVHPDTASPDRVDEFARYAEAYRVLSLPDRRRRYNESLHVFVLPRPIQPGHDLYERLVIPPDLAARGGTAPLCFARYEPCSLCGLAGCHRCQGQGMIPETVCLDVRILPGTQHNATVFLEGQGGRSEPGGSRGDLFVYVALEGETPNDR